MQGIASLLDHSADALVRDIWKTFEFRFGIQAAQKTFAPHFSWHVAEGYPYMQLKKALTSLAQSLPVITITTAGLGFFTRPEPVLYVPIVVTRQLLVLHEELFNAVESMSESPVPYYRPGKWLPHITLAYSDISIESLSKVVDLIKSVDLEMSIEINNYAIFCPSENLEMDICTIPFKGMPQ